jgi:hypothetical protein
MTTVLEPPTTPAEPLAPSRTAADGLSTGRRWVGFAVILSAMILNILDSTIVNVAAPAIQADLGMSTSSLEWVAAAYTLALAVGLMAGARLGDMLGRKPMLMIGMVGFLLASAACSFAGTSGVLIGARVLQGPRRRGHGAADVRADPRPVPAAAARAGVRRVRALPDVGDRGHRRAFPGRVRPAGPVGPEGGHQRGTRGEGDQHRPDVPTVHEGTHDDLRSRRRRR